MDLKFITEQQMGEFIEKFVGQFRLFTNYCSHGYKVQVNYWILTFECLESINLRKIQKIVFGGDGSPQCKKDVKKCT